MKRVNLGLLTFLLAFTVAGCGRGGNHEAEAYAQEVERYVDSLGLEWKKYDFYEGYGLREDSYRVTAHPSSRGQGWISGKQLEGQKIFNSYSIILNPEPMSLLDRIKKYFGNYRWYADSGYSYERQWGGIGLYAAFTGEKLPLKDFVNNKTSERCMLTADQIVNAIVIVTDVVPVYDIVATNLYISLHPVFLDR